MDQTTMKLLMSARTHNIITKVCIRVLPTYLISFEDFEGDSGCSGASAPGRDDDLALAIFSRTNTAHDLTGRPPFSRQQTVMPADRQA